MKTTLRDRLCDEGTVADEGIIARIDSMDLEHKAGQLFMLAFGGDDPARACRMIENHYLGGCYISNENASTPKKAALLSEALQKSANSISEISLLLGVDQEGAWGVMMPVSTTGPGNLGLGAAHDPELTKTMYGVIGEELKAVGYNTLLAPCADVNSNPENPIIGMRSFGGNAAEVACHVEAAICGASEAGVITTVKHFPGHGNTSEDSHRGIPRVDRDMKTLTEVDLAPFAAGIKAGVDIVMTSHILYSAIDSKMPATLSRPVITGLLREQLGFKGVVLSDSMNMRAMKKNYDPGRAAVMALAAGVDMIMLAEEHYDHDAGKYEVAQIATIQGIIDAVRQGELEESALDMAVYRILDLKKRHGLLGRYDFSFKPENVGSKAHKAVEEKVCSRMICAMRNSHECWPISSDSNVALVRVVPTSAYSILTSTRGIGPNQKESAFDAFRGHFITLHTATHVIDFYIGSDDVPIDLSALEKFDVILAVTEDYPLPGVDFDTISQKKAILSLLERFGCKLVVVGLRTPYELKEYLKVKTYICSYSSRPCAAKAAAYAAVGILDTVGISPVELYFRDSSKNL